MFEKLIIFPSSPDKYIIKFTGHSLVERETFAEDESSGSGVDHDRGSRFRCRK